MSYISTFSSILYGHLSNASHLIAQLVCPQTRPQTFRPSDAFTLGRHPPYTKSQAMVLCIASLAFGISIALAATSASASHLASYVASASGLPEQTEKGQFGTNKCGTESSESSMCQNAVSETSLQVTTFDQNP